MGDRLTRAEMRTRAIDIMHAAEAERAQAVRDEAAREGDPAPTTGAANTERERLVRCAIEQAVIWAQKQASRNGLPRHWDLWDAGLVRAAFESFAALSRNALPPAPTTGAAEQAICRKWERALRWQCEHGESFCMTVRKHGLTASEARSLLAATTAPQEKDGVLFADPNSVRGPANEIVNSEQKPEIFPCDGCAQGLPVVDGIHTTAPGATWMRCSATPPAPAETSREPERRAFVYGWLWSVFEFRKERTVDDALAEYLRDGHVRPCPRDHPLLRDGSGA